MSKHFSDFQEFLTHLSGNESDHQHLGEMIIRKALSIYALTIDYLYDDRYPISPIFETTTLAYNDSKQDPFSSASFFRVGFIVIVGISTVITTLVSNG